jgi:hypothetical protein
MLFELAGFTCMNGGRRYQKTKGEMRIKGESRAAIEVAVPQICRVHVTLNPCSGVLWCFCHREEGDWAQYTGDSGCDSTKRDSWN